MADYVTGRDEVNLQSILIGSWTDEMGLSNLLGTASFVPVENTRKQLFDDSLVNDMMAEYCCINGLWHKTHRQQNLTNIQNFWNLDQNKKEWNKAGWKNWKVAKGVAWDRKCWSDSVEAYVPTGMHDDDDDLITIRKIMHNDTIMSL